MDGNLEVDCVLDIISDFDELERPMMGHVRECRLKLEFVSILKKVGQMSVGYGLALKHLVMGILEEESAATATHWLIEQHGKLQMAGKFLPRW